MRNSKYTFHFISSFVLVFLLCAVVLPDTAHACSCVANSSQTEDFANAEAVFVGRVISIEEHHGFAQQLLRTLPFIEHRPSHRTVEFWVTERWKGVNENLVTVATGFGGGDCGFYFAEGEQYLVYAHDGEFYGHGQALATGICSRTEVLRHSNEEVAMLGPGDTSFTDEEMVYGHTGDSRWNEIQNAISEFLIHPITRTIFVSPWYVALGILFIYIAPVILLAYALFKRVRNKK